MNTLIGEVAPRFVVQYANGIRYYDLPPISGTLTSLMAQVGDRFVIQYANANRFYGFTYPQAMIGDTTAPQATAPVVTMLGRGNVKISWTTNEFAQTRFRYGAQSGVYTQTLTDTLYYRAPRDHAQRAHHRQNLLLSVQPHRSQRQSLPERGVPLCRQRLSLSAAGQEVESSLSNLTAASSPEIEPRFQERRRVDWRALFLLRPLSCYNDAAS